MSAVVVDVAGGGSGGAGRFKNELDHYLDTTQRTDVRIVGQTRAVTVDWLVAREARAMRAGRKVALNNVGFTLPGGTRWTLLRNALHFLTDEEAQTIDSATLRTARTQGVVIKAAARRSDVLVVPSNAMADRVGRAVPSLRARLLVRPHPVSVYPVGEPDRGPAILCPVVISSYKRMGFRLLALVRAMETCDPRVTLRITTSADRVPPQLRKNPRVHLIGIKSVDELRREWTACRAVYYPTSIESFGYPLAEARAIGRPVIALESEQNQEIAGSALCGFEEANLGSLVEATARALTIQVDPDPQPFDADAYFSWLFGDSSA